MSELVYLVILDFGQARRLRFQYEEMYRVFRTKEKAFEWAEMHGWKNMLGFDSTIGMINLYGCGDDSVAIIPMSIRD